MILVNKHIVILGVVGLLLTACDLDKSGGDNTDNSENIENSNNTDNSNNADNGSFIVGGNDNMVVIEASDNELQNRNMLLELQSRVQGSFIILPYINSVQPINDQGNNFQWNVPSIQNIQNLDTIDFSDIDVYLTEPSNSVGFKLVFLHPQGFVDDIANSALIEVGSNNGGTIASESLIWFYDDLDRDGLLEVEEIGVLPIDCDGDLLVTNQDADSDNDGIMDGVDSTPNGPPCVN